MTSNFKPSKNRTESAPRLSTEEWAAKKQAEKEAVYAMIDETAAEVVADPAKFQSFHRYCSREWTDTRRQMPYWCISSVPDATQLKSFGGLGRGEYQGQ